MATLGERAARRRQFYRSFEASALRHRSFFTRFSDDLNNAFGSLTFLILNIGFFAFWIAFNNGWIPGLSIIDPFPYIFLTMALSVEAIILAIFILVSQTRQSYVTSLREELHMQINLIAEEEVTKVLKVLAEIRQKMGIREADPELESMIQRINTNYIERSLIEQIQKANQSLAEAMVKRLGKDFPDILHPKSEE